MRSMGRYRAYLICLIASCGSPAAMPDAPSNDASGARDARAIDAAVHSASVELSGASPANVSVVFGNGSALQEVALGADGTAEADIAPDASITLVIRGSGSVAASMISVLGAQPGDHLRLDFTNPDTSSAGAFTVAFTPLADPTLSYEAHGPCGFAQTTTSPALLQMRNDCVTPTMDLLVVALDATSTPVGYTHLPDVAFVAGGSATLPAAFTPAFAFDASFTDLGEVASFFVERVVPASTFGFDASGMVTVAGSAASFGSASVSGAAHATIETVFTATDATLGRQQIVDVIDGAAPSYALDVDARLLGWLGSASFEVTTEHMTIPVDTSHTSADPSDLTFTVFEDRRGSTGTTFAWTVFTATPAGFTLPPLPPDLSDLLPQAGDAVTDINVISIESDGVAGYDVARQAPVALLGLLATPHVLPAGTTRLRITSGL